MYFGEGLILGYQNYIKKRIVIDFIVGLGNNQVISTKVIRAENIDLDLPKGSSLDGILALNIGYRF